MMTGGLRLVLYYGLLKHLPRFVHRGGSASRKMRAACVGPLLDHCGANVNIEHGASFGKGHNIRLGDRSDLGVNCRIHGPVTIGNDVMMGWDVTILTQNHRFDRTDIPMNQQGFSDHERVFIEDDVWIGAGATLLPGIRIGTGAIVGLGAIVTKDVAPFAIVAGNPARLIRSRAPSIDIESDSRRLDEEEIHLTENR